MSGQTGYLNSRLKNLQNKRRSEEGGTSEGSNGKKPKTVTYDDYTEENEIENDVSVEEDLLFLRNAVMPNQTEDIKFKLRSTLKRRIELTSNKPSVHLRSSFPFFFSDPSLVRNFETEESTVQKKFKIFGFSFQISFDYNLRYSQFEENLHQVVAAIKTNAFQILKSLKIEENSYDDSGKMIVSHCCRSLHSCIRLLHTDWPHIIQCFLCLLKMLPPTATGRYSRSRQPSDQRASSFIWFTKVK